MKRGWTLVEVGVAVLVTASLAAFVIPNLLKAKIEANEAAAQKLVRDIAVASESYAFANKGVYPSLDTSLVPKFLPENFAQGIRYGYNFTTTFSPSGYTCTATPVNCRKSGVKIFTISAKQNVAVSACTPTCEAPNACGTYPNCVPCSCSPQCGTYPNCSPCSCSPQCGTYPNCYTCGDTCFLAGTPVLLSNGKSVSIERLKAGDEVMALDTKTGQLKPDKIKLTSKHMAEEYIIINGYLKATANHPIYSNGKLIEVGALRIGDKLLKAKGRPETVTSLKLVKEKTTVYNIRVNPYGTYIVFGGVVGDKGGTLSGDVSGGL